ncbi:MAG TPA: NAD(P)H-dependent oxidoreductase subunit E [Pseudomonadales bacterium]|nr:NAD(P)H-dependent oxidoreductase subunit E [Pseudomonadales bacterium]
MTVPATSVLDRAAEIIAAFVPDQDLVDLLTQLQQELGFIPPQTVALIADVTGVERPAIYRAIELAPSFTLRPPGKHLLYICSADNCCSKGGLALAATAKRVLGVDYYQCDANQNVRMEPFRCLGNCVNGPNISLDNVVQGPMTPEKLEATLLALLKCS